MANDIRNFFAEEFIEYFGIVEQESQVPICEEDECIVTEEYIEENYAELVLICQRCMRMLSSRQTEIVKSIVNNYFALNCSGLAIGDLLFDLGTTEDDIREDLLALQRLDCIDCDEIICLKGKASNLIYLAEDIIQEMIAADEYEENIERAKILFYNLVD